MSDYIKREDAIREAVNAVDEWDGGYITSRDDMIEAYLNNIPAADVRENVRGKWIKYNPLASDVLCCSICEYMPREAEFYHYCPNCGADMRGENDG